MIVVKKIIDIVDIRNAKYLKFYVENDFIYCENCNGERVIVADLLTFDNVDLVEKVSDE